MATELPSLGNDPPSDLVPHTGNIHDLLLVLVLPDCSSWLLGQEGEVPSCSNADADFLPTGCSDGTAAASMETASSTSVAGSDADAGAGDPT